MKEIWRTRSQIDRITREFFWSLNYDEVRTPLFVQSPGMEPHILPFEVKAHSNSHQSKNPIFLPTSPEFAMKKLLAMGMERIFQICPSFRDEPNSPDHHPEFTMLEFYETHATLEQLQNRVESYFITLAKHLHQSLTIPFRNETVNLTLPWPRFRIVDLFQLHLGIDLRTHQSQEDLIKVCSENKITADTHDSWDDLYFKLWLNFIEPKLPKQQPVFITHYPVSQSSLCNRVRDEKGFEWANRFELYVGNLELGNAFDELRNSKIQRENFLKDQKIRTEIYGNTRPASPIDEEFLACIEKIPPTCGIALGLDRIAMLLLNAKTIDEVIPLRSYQG